MRVRIARARAAALALALASCGGDNDPFNPTTENVAGTYAAATFTVTSSTGTVDLLALGAQVDVTLSSDGTTTGNLLVPGGGDSGEDFEANLAGTWSLSDATVTFDHEGDTFIRDVEFTATRNRLTAEDTFGDETVRLVLVK